MNASFDIFFLIFNLFGYLWSLNIDPKHITYYCTSSWFMVLDEKIGMGLIFSLSDHQFRAFSTIISILLLCIFILVDFFVRLFSLQNCWIYISSLINFSISYIVWQFWSICVWIFYEFIAFLENMCLIEMKKKSKC